MPTFFRTGAPPDPESWSGCGWEPSRSWHTPRDERERGSGCMLEQPTRQPLGDGKATLKGYMPHRGGLQAGKRDSSRIQSKLHLPRQQSNTRCESAHPFLMNGHVLAGGRPTIVPAHHRPGYESPDRALVGDEEAAARAAALRRRA
jgi:hypothetical protein